MPPRPARGFQGFWRWTGEIPKDEPYSNIMMAGCE
jgi:hypothetical protein